MLSDRATKARLNKEPQGGLERTTEGGVYHVSRCRSCGRLLTKLEIIKRMRDAGAGGEWEGACTCGSSKFTPSNPKWWEFFLPRVVRLCVAVWRGQVAPGESR